MAYTHIYHKNKREQKQIASHPYIYKETKKLKENRKCYQHKQPSPDERKTKNCKTRINKTSKNKCKKKEKKRQQQTSPLPLRPVSIKLCEWVKHCKEKEIYE